MGRTFWDRLVFRRATRHNEKSNAFLLSYSHNISTDLSISFKTEKENHEFAVLVLDSFE